MAHNKSALWRSLQGIICLYKPPCTSWNLLNRGIRQTLCRELNETVPTTNVPYHRNPLVVGPWHLKNQMSVYSTLTDYATSGVAVVGIRGGWFSARALQKTCPLRVYHVKGRLGEASDEYFVTGKIKERATYHHVTKPIMNKVLASIQSAYQRTMFEANGLNLQSQAAYEMAVSGLVKTVDPKIPVFYGIRCIHFEPPDFTLEVQCVNETSLHLKRLIHMIGFRLRSVALCTAVRCIRYGPFTVDHALVRHRWTLADIVENMNMCTKIYITDAVSDRRSSPKLLSSSGDASWTETEQLLLEKGIIKSAARLQTSENTAELEGSGDGGQWRLEPGEISDQSQKCMSS